MPNRIATVSLSVPVDHRRALLLTVLGALLASAAAAQSFDCAKATTTVEQAVCKDPKLAALDVTLAQAYHRAQAADPGQRDALLANQRQWIAARDHRCLGRPPGGGAELNDCLADAYGARIADLNTHVDPAPNGAVERCRTLVERYRPIATANAGKAPVAALVATPEAHVAATRIESGLLMPIGALRDWGADQNPPVFVTPALIDAVLGDTGGAGEGITVAQLPGSHFYAAGSVQGTMHCYALTYFHVHDGRTVVTTPPPGFVSDDGTDGCLVARYFGRIDDTPVLIDDDYLQDSHLSSTLTVATWGVDDFLGSCTVDFTYAPRITEETLNGWEQSCTGADCEAWKRAAFDLIAEVQADPTTARHRHEAGLTGAQRTQFDSMMAAWHAAGGAESASTDRSPENLLLDSEPLALPFVFKGRVYLARVGHETIGWRTFADWGARFSEIVDAAVVDRATFAFGMKKAELKSAEVRPLRPLAELRPRAGAAPVER